MGSWFSKQEVVSSPKMPTIHDAPLNGLKVSRVVGGKQLIGAVVASTIRGRPTNEVPFLQSEYTVEWSDGTTEGGLSGQAVMLMSKDKEWTSSAWKDAYDDATVLKSMMPSGAGLSTLPLLARSRYTPMMTIQPPPKADASARKPAAVLKTTSVPQAVTPQDKSRINDLFRERPRKDLPAASASQDAASPAILGKHSHEAEGSKTTNKQAPKTTGNKSGRKKRKAVEESEPEDEPEDDDAEEEEEAGEPDVPEFMRRTYPRELSFKEGDVPLEGLGLLGLYML